MRKFSLILLAIITLLIVAACGDNDNSADDPADELLALEVDFIVPESVELGETVELKALVTYGDDIETDAVVKFEVWEAEDVDRENSVMIEAENNGDGSYTAEYTFEEETVYEMYAHTDAQNLHTMPKKEVKVGNAE